jgi:Phage derived protein Gp49-like (DUF891)
MDRLIAERLTPGSAGGSPRDGSGDRRRAAWAREPGGESAEGFGGRGVLEIVDDFDGDTYRAVYTVRFAGVIYVLHAFQKKSKKGIATSKHEIELIKARLKRAEEHHRARYMKDT